MKKWVVCRTTKVGIEYRSTAPDVLETVGWVSGEYLKRVRVWEEKTTAMEYMFHLEQLYPQLVDLRTVKVLTFSETGIIGIMEK